MDVSAHDHTFYKLWDDVRDEVVAAGKASYFNPNFTSQARVGGKVFRTKDEIRQAALMAATKRAQSSQLSNGSGQKLGGVGQGKRISPAELKRFIALAAERRMIDDRWCPTSQELDEGVARDETLCSNSLTASGSETWSCNICMEANKRNLSTCSYCGLDRLTKFSMANSFSSTSSEICNQSQTLQTASSSSFCPPCDITKRSKFSSSKSVTKKESNHTSSELDPVSNKLTHKSDILTEMSESVHWICVVCTYVNEGMNEFYSFNECAVCGSSRSIKQLKSQSSYENSDNLHYAIIDSPNTSHDNTRDPVVTWRCARCTLDNQFQTGNAATEVFCAACNYAYNIVTLKFRDNQNTDNPSSINAFVDLT